MMLDATVGAMQCSLSESWKPNDMLKLHLPCDLRICSVICARLIWMLIKCLPPAHVARSCCIHEYKPGFAFCLIILCRSASHARKWSHAWERAHNDQQLNARWHLTSSVICTTSLRFWWSLNYDKMCARKFSSLMLKQLGGICSTVTLHCHNRTSILPILF